MCVTSDSYNRTMAKPFKWTRQGKAKTASSTGAMTPLCTSLRSDPTRSYALLPIERMIRYKGRGGTVSSFVGNVSLHALMHW
jgi:hypothetical protein